MNFVHVFYIEHDHSPHVVRVTHRGLSGLFALLTSKYFLTIGSDVDEDVSLSDMVERLAEHGEHVRMYQVWKDRSIEIGTDELLQQLKLQWQQEGTA
jgi:hypothetical protein